MLQIPTSHALWWVLTKVIEWEFYMILVSLLLDVPMILVVIGKAAWKKIKS